MRRQFMSDPGALEEWCKLNGCYEAVFGKPNRGATRDIETLNKKNDFVNRTKILKSFDDMVISKTADGSTCIDIIKGDDVLAISLSRFSEYIKDKRYTVDLSDLHDHAPSIAVDAREELRKIHYDVQLSINGIVSDKESASAEVWFGDGKYSGLKERSIEEGITDEEHDAIGRRLRGYRSAWFKFMPTARKLEEMERKRKPLTNQEIFRAALNKFIEKQNS